MIFYLTFNDTPSGIYSSQVIDVVKFLRQELQLKTRLVAFISLRGFFENRKKIKAEMNDALVLPMFPGVKRWRSNSFLLNRLVNIYRPKAIIGRSVLATQLAFGTGVKKIIYDGRGAIAAEWKEYHVITDAKMLSEIDALEKEAVLNSNARIAVSNQLAHFWQTTFGYDQNRHVVIPCTLNKLFEQATITTDSLHKARQAFGFKSNDLVFAYAGSVAGWQSFDMLYDFIAPVLKASQNNKLFFLADADKNILALEKEFPEQVMHKKVKPSQVPDILLAADYGLLIREESITNKVASPVKFAEYLACGLRVIISDNLGDYSTFVKEHNCGHLYTEFIQPAPIPLADKQQYRELALRFFTKINLLPEYTQLLK